MAAPVSLKNLPLSDIVNRRQSKVVNGNQAANYQFPHQVSIKATQGQTLSICGGSIISSLYILTAAHCTRGFASFEIGFGSNLLNAPIVRMISSTKLEHPNFNPTLLTNDISLIRLPAGISFGASIQAVRLPALSQTNTTFVNYQMAVSGFGRTSDNATQVSSVLNYVLMRVISNSECTATFGTTVIVNTVLCAKGWSSNNQNACLGDSGGPLVLIEANNIVTQIGVVSFVSSRGCSYGDPSGYTRIASFLQWISINTGISLRK